MQLKEAIVSVLDGTGHDTENTEDGVVGDDQVTVPQIRRWINRRYEQVRRLLAGICPSLYNATTSAQSFTSVQTPQLDLPTDFERVLRVEVLYSGATAWDTLDPADSYAPEQNATLGYLEEGGVIRLVPSRLAAGTGHQFRLVYNVMPDKLEDDEDEILVPRGVDDHIIETVSFRVRTRDNDDNGPHVQYAAQLWAEQAKALRRRYRQPESGLRRQR